MTDKQIKEVFKNGFYCIEPCPEIKELQAELKRKEQECERLKKIINEAKNSKLDLKSFLVGEAVQNEYEQQLDQLKAENDLAKQLINWILKFFELTDYDWQDDQNEISALIEDYIDDKNSTIDFVNDINKGLLKKLTEIKEIAKNGCYDDCGMPLDELSIILQKISECEVVDERKR